MKKERFSLFLLISLILIFTFNNINTNGYKNVNLTEIRGNYNKIILITWDGTRPEWLDQYSSNGELEAVQKMRNEGGEIYLGLGDTPSSTNPCLSTIETGL